MSNIKEINQMAGTAAKLSDKFVFSEAKKIYINGRHNWLNQSTVPRSIKGSRLGLRKREQIAQTIRKANDGLLIKK